MPRKAKGFDEEAERKRVADAEASEIRRQAEEKRRADEAAEKARQEAAAKAEADRLEAERIFNSFRERLRRGGLSVLFSKCSMSDMDGQEVAQAIFDEVNTKLAHLDMSSNIIGDPGSSVLAQSLEKASNLTELHLGFNQIGDQGAIALAEALESHISMRIIGLEHNQIGDAGAEALGRCLRINSKIRTLQLHKNQIKDRGVIALATALYGSGSLHHLTLHGNPRIGDRGVAAMARAMLVNKSVQQLTLPMSTSPLPPPPPSTLSPNAAARAAFLQSVFGSSGADPAAADPAAAAAEGGEEQKSNDDEDFTWISSAGAGMLSEAVRMNGTLVNFMGPGSGLWQDQAQRMRNHDALVIQRRQALPVPLSEEKWAFPSDSKDLVLGDLISSDDMKTLHQATFRDQPCQVVEFFALREPSKRGFDLPIHFSNLVRDVHSELRANVAARHRNIVNLLHCGFMSLRALSVPRWIVTDYIAGARTLAEILKEMGSLQTLPVSSETPLYSCIIQLALALAYLHDQPCHVSETANRFNGQPIIHRDIRPENILVQLDRVYLLNRQYQLPGHVYLNNLGLNVIAAGCSQNPIGNAHYMAPETYTLGVCDKPPRDMYALGATILEMVTGQTPAITHEERLLQAHAWVSEHITPSPQALTRTISKLSIESSCPSANSSSITPVSASAKLLSSPTSKSVRFQSSSSSTATKTLASSSLQSLGHANLLPVANVASPELHEFDPASNQCVGRLLLNLLSTEPVDRKNAAQVAEEVFSWIIHP